MKKWSEDVYSSQRSMKTLDVPAYLKRLGLEMKLSPEQELITRRIILQIRFEWLDKTSSRKSQTFDQEVKRRLGKEFLATKGSARSAGSRTTT